MNKICLVHLECEFCRLCVSAYGRGVCVCVCVCVPVWKIKDELGFQTQITPQLSIIECTRSVCFKAKITPP